MANMPSIHRRRDEIASELRLIKQRLAGIRRHTPSADRAAVESAISEITNLIRTVRKIGIDEAPVSTPEFRLKPLFADGFAPWND